MYGMQKKQRISAVYGAVHAEAGQVRTNILVSHCKHVSGARNLGSVPGYPLTAAMPRMAASTNSLRSCSQPRRLQQARVTAVLLALLLLVMLLLLLLLTPPSHISPSRPGCFPSRGTRRCAIRACR